jgi:hypothetical protein
LALAGGKIETALDTIIGTSQILFIDYLHLCSQQVITDTSYPELQRRLGIRRRCRTNRGGGDGLLR